MSEPTPEQIVAGNKAAQTFGINVSPWALQEIYTAMRALERPSDEAVEPRFFIDHGMIHDRATGKHVSTEPIEFDEGQFDTSPMLEACALLNELASRAAIAAMREQSK